MVVVCVITAVPARREGLDGLCEKRGMAWAGDYVDL